MARVLAFSGSLRLQSFNARLVRVAAEGARAAGAEVTVVDLRDFPLPVFDEDLEAREGLHPSARRLKDLFLSHHALLISSPEYNSSYSAALKNALDWVSRPAKLPNGSPEPPLGCFTGKVVGVMSASPGALGGIRMLPELRRLLANLGCILLPQQMAISKAHEAFDEAGNLKDAKSAAAVRDIGARVAQAAAKLA